MFKGLLNTKTEQKSFDEDIEIDVPWRESNDSISDSVIQKTISKEEYLKHKVVSRFKEGLLDLMPEGAVLELRYDLDGVHANELSRLDTALKILAGHSAVLGQATKSSLICRLYPLAQGQLAVHFLWTAPRQELQSRSRAKNAIMALVKAHQHKKLSIKLEHNKETFATSDLIGFLMVFSAEPIGTWRVDNSDHGKDA